MLFLSVVDVNLMLGETELVRSHGVVPLCCGCDPRVRGDRASQVPWCCSSLLWM